MLLASVAFQDDVNGECLEEERESGKFGVCILYVKK
jgi:hypothetical protein